MNEFNIFIVDQKSENTEHITKYEKQTLCKLCKALLVECSKGHNPQATREVRKIEVNNCFSEGYFGDQQRVALQRVTW